MAKIGLKHFKYAKLTEAADGTPSYTGIKSPGKAVSCNVSITTSTGSLYADDITVETASVFTGGTAALVVDDDDLETQAELLGHTYSNGEIIRNTNDNADYFGIGRVVVKLIEGIMKYKVEVLYKVKFSEPNQEDTTRGENIEFKTTELTGNISQLKNGNWSIAKTFDTEAAAITYLETTLGATVPPNNNTRNSDK